MQRNYRAIRDESKFSRDGRLDSYQGEWTDEEALINCINLCLDRDSRGERARVFFRFKSDDLILAFLKQCPDSIKQLQKMECEDSETKQIELDADASTLTGIVDVSISDTDIAAHN